MAHILNYENLIKILLFAGIFTLLFFFSNCKGDGENEPLARISNLKIFDIENSGTATDIAVEFEKPLSEDNIGEYRVFMAKIDEELTKERAVLLKSDKYAVIPVSEVEVSEEEMYVFVLPSDFQTTNGEIIANDSTYKAYVLTVSDKSGLEPVISEVSNTLTLTVTNLVDTIAENIPAGTGGLSLDGNGNIYAGNFGLTFNAGGNNIFRITPEGSVSEFATGLDGAAGNDFDDSGNLFQTNFSGGTISKIDIDGNVEEYIGVNNQINGPVGLIIVDDGSLFVTNCSGNNVIKVSPDKTIDTLASGSIFNCPNGITMDEQGNLYVTNFNNSTIVKLADDSTTSAFKTLPGGQVTHPFYSNGFIYAVSRGDLKIYRVSVNTGEHEVIAGSGMKGERTGSALDAEFVRLNDLAVTPDGSTIYINDTQIEGDANSQLGPITIKRIRLVENN